MKKKYIMKKNSRTSNKIINISYLIILIPLILVMSLDLIFTITGQSKDYWKNYSDYNEVNPIGQTFLSANPIYFMISYIFYIILVLFLIIKLPRPINIMLYIGFFLGHVWGSSTWISEILSRYFSIEMNEFYSRIIYFIIIAIISGLCLNKIIKNFKLSYSK
ncbi:MAG: hypothetical protein Q8N99_08080 [Nanoarchaeota archaeon]|nr:hypothetical protein [Nanoarchaeota archaeon]